MNKLYFGDNLDILREYVEPASVDLVYLDPPFNSKADYNVLFRSPASDVANAQVEAFRDTWTWLDEAEFEYNEIMSDGGSLAAIIGALHKALGESDMMAYLVMMAQRLQALRIALKPTGSLYLHCDPTASHYLKVVMDGIFGPLGFQGEVIWKRTNSRGTKGRWPRLHDVILHYAVDTKKKTFNRQRAPGDLHKIPHTLITKADGLKYQTYELTGAGITKDGESGKPWRGYDPSTLGRHWGTTPDELDLLDARGEIHLARE
jgi:DNA modification methylase